MTHDVTKDEAGEAKPSMQETVAEAGKIRLLHSNARPVKSMAWRLIYN